MRIAFLSMNFPPEVNALATRTHRHTTRWASKGTEVEVITDVPHFPEGEVYDGYENRYQQETVDGVRVHRVPMYVAPNSGIVHRMLSFGSFMLSSVLHGIQRLSRPDVVVASSPQFLTAVAGYLISRATGAPFVLEVRDLWPESIVAVGAMERNPLIRTLESIETHLYRQADHVVVVTERFREHVTERGADPRNVSVIMNGIDTSIFASPDEEEVRAVEQEFALAESFVVSYIGTIGMAHRADVLLEAAKRCDDRDITFVVVGEGARREALADRAEASDLDNFRLVPKQPRSRVPALLAASDVSLVHLRDEPLFETVVPSKLFEAMAMGNPVIHGVRGESRDIVEAANAGIPVEPDSPEAIVRAARRLKDDHEMYSEMSRCGMDYVRTHHDRTRLADRFHEILREVVGT